MRNHICQQLHESLVVRAVRGDYFAEYKSIIARILVADVNSFSQAPKLTVSMKRRIIPANVDSRVRISAIRLLGGKDDAGTSENLLQVRQDLANNCQFLSGPLAGSFKGRNIKRTDGYGAVVRKVALTVEIQIDDLSGQSHRVGIDQVQTRQARCPPLLFAGYAILRV